VSDFNGSLIDVFAGSFAGQGPCAQITSGVANPWGLFVERATHDLYVADVTRHQVLVFHRGQLTAYNAYKDPTGRQKIIDITVADDGTVFASNANQASGPEDGSISTWIKGPHGGTFVGNFPMKNDIEGLYITVKKNGTVYFSNLDPHGHGTLWTVKCPAGACGAQTQVPGVSFHFPGGMRINSTNDLLAVDQTAHTLETYELPNTNPAAFSLNGYPTGMDFDELSQRVFIADTEGGGGAEYTYPGGVLVGTVLVNHGAYVVGIAVDPSNTR
jgi:hypothetical protein